LQNEINKTAEILASIPQERIQEMQTQLSKVWRRFLWGSVPAFRAFDRAPRIGETAEDPDAEVERDHRSFFTSIPPVPGDPETAGGHVPVDYFPSPRGTEKMPAEEEAELEELVAANEDEPSEQNWVPHYSDSSDDALDTLLAWLYKKAVTREAGTPAESEPKSV
jgi:hypothetical protein